MFVSISITNVEWKDDGLHLKVVNGVKGETYRLQAAENLVSGSWTDIAMAAGTADGWEVVDSEARQHSTRFYRVVTP